MSTMVVTFTGPGDLYPRRRKIEEMACKTLTQTQYMGIVWEIKGEQLIIDNVSPSAEDSLMFKLKKMSNVKKVELK